MAGDGGGGAEPGCLSRWRPSLLDRETSSNVRAWGFASEAIGSVTRLSVGPFPSTLTSLAAVLALLLGGEGRGQAIVCKDVAAPSVPANLQERKSLRALINSVGISGGETPQSPCSSETGGIGDRNKACRCPRARKAQLWGEALSKLDRASLQRSHVRCKGWRMLEFAPFV